MKKDKTYKQTKFGADVLREAIDKLREVDPPKKDQESHYRSVETENSTTWKHDSLDEFFADYRRNSGWANMNLRTSPSTALELRFQKPLQSTEVSIQGTDRATIESVFEVFEKHAASSRLPESPKPPAPKPVVFIGHGRSASWRDLKDHLQDKHGYAIEAYEVGARAGHTIRDVLSSMMSKSNFALLVLTGEDEMADGEMRARQNVIHEAGLFQGRLGFPRAILLLEKDVELFSNVQGVQYIQFSKGNIREVFGEVLATLRREFS